MMVGKGGAIDHACGLMAGVQMLSVEAARRHGAPCGCIAYLFTL